MDAFFFGQPQSVLQHFFGKNRRDTEEHPSNILRYSDKIFFLRLENNEYLCRQNHQILIPYEKMYSFDF